MNLLVEMVLFNVEDSKIAQSIQEMLSSRLEDKVSRSLSPDASKFIVRFISISIDV